MKKLLTKTAKLFFIVALTFMASCESEEASTDLGDNDPGVNPYGNWVRGDGQDSYLKFGTGTVSNCSNGNLTVGTFNASEPSMTYVVQGEVIKFPLKFNSNNSLLVGVPDQAVDTNTAMIYYRSEDFPCDGGGGGGSGGGTGGGTGGGSTTGKVLFWTSSDLGCGVINVSINGSSGSIAGYYSSGSPECGASYGANFTLTAGTYNFTASCSSYNWSGTVSVTANGCSRMQLYN